jgi:hypothetical protein
VGQQQGKVHVGEDHLVSKFSTKVDVLTLTQFFSFLLGELAFVMPPS